MDDALQMLPTVDGFYDKDRAFKSDEIHDWKPQNRGGRTPLTDSQTRCM
jgi:hypothetical protein